MRALQFAFVFALAILCSACVVSFFILCVFFPPLSTFFLKKPNSLIQDFFKKTVNFPKVAFVSSMLHEVLGSWGFIMHLKSSLDRSSINFLTLNRF